MDTSEGNTQPSNSNTIYFPPPSIPMPISPSYTQPSHVYVYDNNYPFTPYYACYHRSPVDYPPTPTPTHTLEQNYEDATPQSPSTPRYYLSPPPLEQNYEDATPQLPSTPPYYLSPQNYEDATPQSPSTPPYYFSLRPDEPTASHYTLQQSPPHNQMSLSMSPQPFKFNATSSYTNNSTSLQYNPIFPYMTTGYAAYCPEHGFLLTGHTEEESSTMNNDNEEEVVNKSYSEPREESCPPHSAVFDCNICMDMAKEPVVTSCGHLYCWPCLYNWLHYHSTDSKCPVCNGEVLESMITPIYGQETYNDGNSSIRVPPRPCGQRF